MMRRIAAALLTTALIAGPAFAASPASDAGKASATATAGSGDSVEKQATKPGKAAKVHHARKHIVRRRGGKTTQHVTRLKTHRRHLVAHVISKPVKVERAGKSDKS